MKVRRDFFLLLFLFYVFRRLGRHRRIAIQRQRWRNHFSMGLPKSYFIDITSLAPAILSCCLTKLATKTVTVFDLMRCQMRLLVKF